MAMPPLPDSRTEPDGSAVIRVLTYNIRSMRDDRAALARVIRACAPDLVFVQEAPRFFRWRKYASWLARATDLVVLGGGATAAGPLLLCSLRATVESTRDVLLPRTPGLHRRGFATAVVRFGRARLGVLSCHLSLNAGERLDQAGKVLDGLKSMDAPHSVAAGDINEQPTGRAFRLLADQLQDGWATAPWGTEHTHGATSPDRRIDAVFATPGVEVLTCGVPAGLDGLSPRDLRRASAPFRLPRLPGGAVSSAASPRRTVRPSEGGGFRAWRALGVGQLCQQARGARLGRVGGGAGAVSVACPGGRRRIPG